uniref:Uncharacterized protein n=1 Tax=Rhizophora mucronata TaxID=61149 RepID=A0A2P2PLP9_RHIMU
MFSRTLIANRAEFAIFNIGDLLGTLLSYQR